MGPMNLPMDGIVIVAAAWVGAGVWCNFNRGGGWQRWLGAVGLMLISAAMLGHAFARIGPEVLAQKPKLYFMQSGGLALAFVIPALLLVGQRNQTPWRATMRDAAVLLFAYLGMGAMFMWMARLL